MSLERDEKRSSEGQMIYRKPVAFAILAQLAFLLLSPAVRCLLFPVSLVILIVFSVFAVAEE